jgi:hypothetical protein
VGLACADPGARALIGASGIIIIISVENKFYMKMCETFESYCITISFNFNEFIFHIPIRTV